MANYNTLTNENVTPKWIGAGRYHPGWTLKEWQRELERSPDLWWAVSRIDSESVTKNVHPKVLFGGHITDQHRFTDEHEGKEYVLLQCQLDEPDVFWLYDLVVDKVRDKSNLQIQVRRILEVYDTVDGMILGDKVVEYDAGDVFFFDGKSRYVVGDKESAPLEEEYDYMPEEHLSKVYTTVQNWAYRKLH